MNRPKGSPIKVDITRADLDAVERELKEEINKLKILKPLTNELNQNLSGLQASVDTQISSLDQHVDLVWDHLNLPEYDEAKVKVEEDNEANKVREQVNELFYELILQATEPGAPANQLEMWKMLINMNWLVFENFWRRVTPEQPKFNFHKSFFDEGSLPNGGTWKGLRSALTQKFHGPQR